MSRIARRTLFKVGAAGSVIALVLVGESASASIPSQGGTIYGCYAKSTGATRIIDPSSQTCTGAEKPISWSQRGPIGPRGATGARGPVGPAGAKGSQGSRGSWVQGFIGFIGLRFGPSFKSR